MLKIDTKFHHLVMA